ncbi:uncharacterized protein LOC110723471 [Chenopodium quinoa]|uniref:uncharacterized protein LOC110723471 n=1 Tax=Chenopodium quinoa TaxID=63459 RepID=UPI000B77176B|nr:uncharacterized protein LOC110723471 [Chenopodium quinoa]
MAGDDVPPPPPPPFTEIKPNSPFYLGSQDRPGDFITPTRLKTDNYDDWAADMQTALEARRKFGFLDGSILAPVHPCTQSDWTAINAMLISWITNTIDPEVRSSLSKFREARLLWQHLKQRFAQTNGPRIQQLKSSIAKCEQTRSMYVSVYYSKLHALWQELDHHEPLISCSCCSKCTAGQLHEARREQAKLHDFLMGLYSDFYASLRTNILSQDPLPSLDRAYQLVVQDERVRTAKLEHEQKPPDALGFAIRTGAGRGASDRGRDGGTVCGKCKKIGHETSNCWSDKTCNYCKKKGHIESKCYDLHGRPSSIDNGQGGVFSSEQWKAITGLFSNANVPEHRLNGKFDVTSWIIDIRATHHVTGDESWLFDTKSFECPVGLPNGDTVLASLVGSVRLSDKLTLTGVLFVPNLSCNLLSVSQITDELNCIVQFNPYMCAIQDQTKELIGTGARRDGLYYFSKSDSVHHVGVDKEISSLELWHRRMGH